MPTTALPLTAAYTKLVDAAVADFTLQVVSESGGDQPFGATLPVPCAEFVFAAALPDATQEGLKLAQFQALTRANGTGHLYGRAIARPGKVGIVGRAVLTT
ncbi:MAG: hypothetical protein EOM22_06880 [Gammaproteobacteria bacterium]|nr:hypothetical protein [Gammaproteobacteria bacterium]